MHQIPIYMTAYECFLKMQKKNRVFKHPPIKAMFSMFFIVYYKNIPDVHRCLQNALLNLRA